jgi:hypothetical protein
MHENGDKTMTKKLFNNIIIYNHHKCKDLNSGSWVTSCCIHYKMITYHNLVTTFRPFGTQILNNHNWKKIQSSKSFI